MERAQGQADSVSTSLFLSHPLHDPHDVQDQEKSVGKEVAELVKEYNGLKISTVPPEMTQPFNPDQD